MPVVATRWHQHIMCSVIEDVPAPDPRESSPFLTPPTLPCASLKLLVRTQLKTGAPISWTKGSADSFRRLLSRNQERFLTYIPCIPKDHNIREIKMGQYLCHGRDSNLSFVGSKALGIFKCRVPRSDLSSANSAITLSTDTLGFLEIYLLVLDTAGLRNLGISWCFCCSRPISAAGAGKCSLRVPAGVMGKLGKRV